MLYLKDNMGRGRGNRARTVLLVLASRCQSAKNSIMTTPEDQFPPITVREVADNFVDPELETLFAQAELLDKRPNQWLSLRAEDVRDLIRAAWAMGAKEALDSPDRIQSLFDEYQEIMSRLRGQTGE